MTTFLQTSPITANDLLNAFLDLHGLSSNLSDWTEEGLAWNPPRHIRLKRRKAMFLAFGIEWNPAAFFEGKLADASAFDSIQNQAKAEISFCESETFAPHHFRTVFWVLFRHRTYVRTVLSQSAGVASGLFRFAFDKIYAVQNALREKITPIEALLAELIDPRRRSFTVEQLIQDYGYPTDDLQKIDCEWD